MNTTQPLRIDIFSDVVCPWCYVGRKRLDDALAAVADIPVELHWRPFFLQPDLPREGMDRQDFIEARFGSLEAYKARSQQLVAIAEAEGLPYRPDLIRRQPNTLDSHRLIHWAGTDPAGDRSSPMKRRLMELFFAEGGDLGDTDVLVQAAADCGMDPGSVRGRLATDEDADAVSAAAGAASAQGIDGVPTFVFAAKYALSGAQPADLLARAIRQVSAELNEPAAG
ncbi:DsbA family oxidoreductase [Labrys monachus]|uniref:DsbA family dithiol-disulfide isomerase n=1 Tax=Labrys monachus TaxID=217067 RepID=A0ABU0FPJ7_9HYPH|nr:DsbA family oxidoreductase [Labrys monachus]MDQ0396029.1 putative DsbA family dithiol-disulfide isomerase [Labrys monachus]